MDLTTNLSVGQFIVVIIIIAILVVIFMALQFLIEWFTKNEQHGHAEFHPHAMRQINHDKEQRKD